MEHLEGTEALSAALGSSGRVKYSAIDVATRLVVLGANTGSVYLFEQNPIKFKQLLSLGDQIRDPISVIKLSPDETLLAFASKASIFIVELNLGKKEKLIQKVNDHKDSEINALVWAKDGSILFSSDEGGLVLGSSITKARSFFFSADPICKCESRIVQLDTLSESHVLYLVVSTLTKTTIFNVANKQTTVIGKKERNGKYGGCYHALQSCFFSARPQRRLWSASLDGKVLATMIFEDYFDQESEYALTPSSLTPSTTVAAPPEANFGKVLPFGRYLISWDERSLFLIDVEKDNVEMLGWMIEPQVIHDVCVSGERIFVLHGTNRIVSIVGPNEVVQHRYDEQEEEEEEEEEEEVEEVEEEEEEEAGQEQEEEETDQPEQLDEVAQQEEQPAETSQAEQESPVEEPLVTYTIDTSKREQEEVAQVEIEPQSHQQEEQLQTQQELQEELRQKQDEQPQYQEQQQGQQQDPQTEQPQSTLAVTTQTQQTVQQEQQIQPESLAELELGHESEVQEKQELPTELLQQLEADLSKPDTVEEFLRPTEKSLQEPQPDQSLSHAEQEPERLTEYQVYSAAAPVTESVAVTPDEPTVVKTEVDKAEQEVRPQEEDTAVVLQTPPTTAQATESSSTEPTPVVAPVPVSTLEPTAPIPAPPRESSESSVPDTVLVQESVPESPAVSPPPIAPAVPISTTPPTPEPAPTPATVQVSTPVPTTEPPVSTELPQNEATKKGEDKLKAQKPQVSQTQQKSKEQAPKQEPQQKPSPIPTSTPTSTSTPATPTPALLAVPSPSITQSQPQEKPQPQPQPSPQKTAAETVPVDSIALSSSSESIKKKAAKKKAAFEDIFDDSPTPVSTTTTASASVATSGAPSAPAPAEAPAPVPTTTVTVKTDSAVDIFKAASVSTTTAPASPAVVKPKKKKTRAATILPPKAPANKIAGAPPTTADASAPGTPTPTGLPAPTIPPPEKEKKVKKVKKDKPLTKKNSEANLSFLELSAQQISPVSAPAEVSQNLQDMAIPPPLDQQGLVVPTVDTPYPFEMCASTSTLVLHTVKVVDFTLAPIFGDYLNQRLTIINVAQW